MVKEIHSSTCTKIQVLQLFQKLLVKFVKKSLQLKV